MREQTITTVRKTKSCTCTHILGPGYTKTVPKTASDARRTAAAEDIAGSLIVKLLLLPALKCSKSLVRALFPTPDSATQICQLDGLGLTSRLPNVAQFRV